MRKEEKQTVLITGPTAGIGHELAWIFAAAGYDLVLVARSQEKLAEMQQQLEQKFGISVRIIAKDLSRPLSPDDIYRALNKESVKIDILINNAGFGTYGYFAETDLASEVEMLQLNVVSLTHLTKLFVKEMVERKRGKIMNVASTAAFQPGPLMAAYYASKAYVLSFSRALREELTGTGVTVTVLCPGPTESKFQGRAGLGHVKLFEFGLMSSKEVAKAGYEGLMKNKTVVIPGILNFIFVYLARLSPTAITVKVVRFLQEKTKTKTT